MNLNHQAIFNLYPSVTAVDDAIGPVDVNDNLIVIDTVAVQAETERLEGEAVAAEEARATAKASAESKLEALGLTKADLVALLG
jgi:hypothetical protein